MTRRTFQRMLGGAAAASAGMPAATKLRLGIGTYTFHKLSIDATIEQVTRLGLREIELSHGDYMLFNKPAPEKFEAMRRMFDLRGISCVSYYTATIKDDSDLESAVRNAQILGARHITGDATGDVLRRIDERISRQGLTFGIHNHYFKQGFAYETPDDILRALAGRSDAMGASLDLGHIVSCGGDTVEAIRKLAGRLQLVHLKDVQAAGGEVNVLLGQGRARIPEAMAELRKMNFGGLLAIEYESEDPVDGVVRTEVEYVRRML